MTRRTGVAGRAAPSGWIEAACSTTDWGASGTFCPASEASSKDAPSEGCGGFALTTGAAAPVLGLLDHFEDEVRAHITEKRCPFGNPPPALRGRACGTRPIVFGPTPCPEDACPI